MITFFKLHLHCSRFMNDLVKVETLIKSKFRNIECLNKKHFKNIAQQEKFFETVLQQVFCEVWNSMLLSSETQPIFLKELSFLSNKKNSQRLRSRNFSIPKQFNTKRKRKSPRIISLKFKRFFLTKEGIELLKQNPPKTILRKLKRKFSKVQSKNSFPSLDM